MLGFTEKDLFPSPPLGIMEIAVGGQWLPKLANRLTAGESALCSHIEITVLESGLSPHSQRPRQEQGPNMLLCALAVLYCIEWTDLLSVT